MDLLGLESKEKSPPSVHQALRKARRFRKMAEESERKYDLRIKKDITADPRYKSMLTILSNSPIFNK